MQHELAVLPQLTVEKQEVDLVLKLRQCLEDHVYCTTFSIAMYMCGNVSGFTYITFDYVRYAT